MKAKILIPTVIIVGGIALTTFTERVPQGYVGVVYDKFNGGVQNELLTEGTSFVLPWQKVNLFATSTEVVYMSKDKSEDSDVNNEMTVNCNDGSLKADLTYTYHFNVDDIVKVQRKYRGKSGKEIMNTILRGQLRGWVSEVTKNYSTMDVHLTKKDEINAKLTESLNKKAKEYGITFENITIMETRPSEKVQEAIEKRQQIAQELEQQKLNLEKKEIEKESARLEAEKKLIEAEGERKANEAKAQGLDDRILKQQAIEKWNGVLPTTVGADTIIGGR